MFGRKKSSVDITPDSPVFFVRYIGSTETFVANGRGCTHAPVQKIWDNAQDETDMGRVSITISPSGICMRDLDKKDDPGIKFPIDDISYCNADSEINIKLFSWICKVHDSPKMECHAVLCSSIEKARAMALVLSRAFQIAYKDWKADKKKIERKRSTSLTQSSSSAQEKPVKSKSNGTCNAIIKGKRENPTNDLSRGRCESMNITHDENSDHNSSRDSGSVTENNAIMDPEQLQSLRGDERVQAMTGGDMFAAQDGTSGGLVMV